MLFEENFYTYKYQSQPASRLKLEYEAYETKDEKTSALIAKIEYHLAQGHENFYKKHFYDALNEYRNAEGLIYKMAEPAFNASVSQGSDVTLSVNPSLFPPIMETTLSAMERIPETMPPFVIGSRQPSDPVDSLINYFDLGVQERTTIPGVDDEVGHLNRLGDEHVRAGQPESAIELYSQALHRLGENSRPGLRAGLQHNLGLAYAETGQLNLALEQLDQARHGYVNAGDRVAEGAVFEN